jgi:hypothetical protein
MRASLLFPLLVLVACGDDSAGPTPPGGPSSLSATAVSARAVNLSWTDTTSTEDGFVVEQCSGASCTEFALVDTAATNATGHSVFGLSPGTTYRFRVRAFNEGGASSFSNTADATTAIADFFVDVASGDDANAGTSAAPFKTITHGLSVADSGEIVKVAPGEYTEASGETFPFVVPAGVALIGDEANKGGGATPTAIVGGDTVVRIHPTAAVDFSAALELRADAVVAGFIVLDTVAALANGLGIVLREDRATVRNNRILNTPLIGIYLVRESVDQVIAGNILTGNRLGIGLVGGGLGARIENNVVTGNRTGVEMDRVPDLGGGAKGSVGGNVFSCNTDFDLWTNTGATISATNNFWDHVPPTEDAGMTGFDIANNANGMGAATFVTTGAALAAAPCT